MSTQPVVDPEPGQLWYCDTKKHGNLTVRVLRVTKRSVLFRKLRQSRSPEREIGRDAFAGVFRPKEGAR